MDAKAQVRLKELAALLGLSVTTVSRALAGYPDVRPATRERVHEAAEAHGYVASRIGRMLVSGRSDFVGMMLPIGTGEIIDAFLGEFLVGLTDRLAERDRDLFLATVPKGKSDGDVLRHLVDGSQVDGVVVNRTTVDDPRVRALIARRVPFVAHGRLLDAPGPFSWLDTDGELAFCELAERLAALGHRRIALLAPGLPYTYVHFRRKGFAAGIERAGIERDAVSLVELPSFDHNVALGAARALLTSDPRPTAIVGLTDRLAFGVLAAARELGIDVPGELSIVGFDNVPAAAITDPGLSTFDQRTRECAGLVGDMVVDLIEHGPGAISTRLIKPTFVPRGSHGPAPATPARPARRAAERRALKGGKRG